MGITKIKSRIKYHSVDKAETVGSGVDSSGVEFTETGQVSENLAETRTKSWSFLCK